MVAGPRGPRRVRVREPTQESLDRIPEYNDSFPDDDDHYEGHHQQQQLVRKKTISSGALSDGSFSYAATTMSDARDPNAGLGSHIKEVREAQLRKLRTYKRVLRDSQGRGTVGLQVPQDSLYGSAMVLPQVSSNMDWEPTYLGKTIKTLIMLVLNICIQSLFVSEVFRLLVIQSQHCEDGGKECGPQWQKSRKDILPGVQWYRCGGLTASEEEEHDVPLLSLFIPGSMLRWAAMCTFVIVLFKDMRQTLEMAGLLWSLPNRRGHWIKFETDDQDVMDLRYKVASMPRPWKVFNFITLIIPKFLIWVSLLTLGGVWLMNTEEREQLILNAVALVFILEVDEMLFAALTSADVQENMDNLQSYVGDRMMVEAMAELGDSDEEEEEELSSEDSDDEEDSCCRRRLRHWGVTQWFRRQRHLGLGRWAEIVLLEVLLYPCMLGLSLFGSVFLFKTACSDVEDHHHHGPYHSHHR